MANTKYGGTAGEMARLVNESGVLGDAMDVTAETVKDVPFDKMIEAIHEVQTEMGVTGTTVKEAEETVSGSFGMMKASFMDLSAGFGQEGANIEGLFENLWSSVGTFTDNIKRVLGTMWDNLPLAGWQKWLGVITVAMGPLLTVGGTVIMFLGGVFRAITPVTAAIAKAGGLAKWLAPLITKLGAVFTFLTGPVGLTIAAIAALGAGFVLAYNKSETFRNFIDGLKDKFMGAWESAMEFKDKVVTAFEGVIAIFKGDHIGAAEMLSSIGLSEETIDNVFLAVAKIRIAFEDVKDKIGIALGKVKDFFVGAFEDIKSWWDSDGALIFDAMQTVVENVFDGIKVAVDFGLTFVKDLFERFAPIIEGIWGVLWPTIQFLVENVWEKIKLVIGVAMDLIQGIISGVAALIEGDWERFGEIISETASSIWTRVVEFFTNMKENALTLFGELFSGAVQWFVNMYESLKQRATFIKTVVVFAFTALKNEAVRRIVEMYNSVKQWFSDLWTTVKNTVANMKNNVVNLFVNMKDGAIDGVKKLYTGTKNLFDDVKDYAKDTFTNMVDGAKELPGKLGSAISNGASKAVDGVKSLGNKMTGKLGSVVNGVIRGLNSITGKIGITSTISKWNVPRFSTGTGQGSPSGKLTKNGKIAMDTLATVGDKGKGNGKGTRELVHYPNGKVGLYDNDATIFAPKGTTIFSNKETESMLGQIPKFSEGTGLWGSIKALAGKAVDYITNPKKIFDDLIALVGDSFGDMSGFAGNFIKGAWSMIKDGMFGWIKGKFSEASVGKSQKWMNYKMTTPYSPNAAVPGYPTSFNGGRHYGIDYGTPTGVNITSPMAGTVSRMSDRGGGNVARLDAAGKAAQYFMHMNSVKTGKVGIGDSVGKSGNTGEWTTGPHVHWQHEDPSASYVQNRFTKNPLSMIKGHLKGGQILSDGLFNLHKGEYVINPNEPTEAMKLLAIVGKKLAGKSKQTREVASVATGYGNSDKIVEVLLEQNKLLMESNNKMNKAINVLLGIEDKTGFDPGKAKKSIDRHIDDRSLIY